MARIRFPLKVVTICSGKEAGFDCRNNHGRSKLASFQPDIISKINCKTLVVMSYISLGLGWRKVKPVQKDFK